MKDITKKVHKAIIEMDKIIIDAPTKELEDAIRDKLLNHFDEQEALKEALEREEEDNA